MERTFTEIDKERTTEFQRRLILAKIIGDTSNSLSSNTVTSENINIFRTDWTLNYIDENSNVTLYYLIFY